MATIKQSYLLLDGAQIDNVRKRIYELEPAPEFHLLYQQTRYAELADVGPVLVRAEPSSALLSEFKSLWEASAGIALDSSMPESNLVSHLRSLIHLRSNADVVLLFRYYDPRILRTWLASLGEAERARIMGPVANIHLRPSATEPVQTYHNPTLTQGQVYDERPWLRLDSDQLALLNAARQQCFDQRLIEHVNQWFPTCLASADEQERQAWAAQCRSRAAEYGYSSANEVARWAGCVALLGTHFPEAAEHEVFRTLLSQPQATPMQRLDKVMMEIQRQLLTQDKEPVA
ncbi:DUF4123 domain-containing protein [Halopseudomonas pelagia]|uniref:DUF4123 domain-containing protein n=1 Tax=Halopseudomonas pelagia TaxID=553151 RepID=UPI0003A9D48B|nr:DUF4123 domain-containing protein [Halopseudomonas pelagia]|tara:strand:+ start:515 stop:1378 length:864 start_codon:yes stop_codon:yes gene_type:complete